MVKGNHTQPCAQPDRPTWGFNLANVGAAHRLARMSGVDMPRGVAVFLEQYRDAFNRLDGEAIADLYCVPSGIVSDRGFTPCQAREPIVKNMVALCDL